MGSYYSITNDLQYNVELKVCGEVRDSCLRPGETWTSDKLTLSWHQDVEATTTNGRTYSKTCWSGGTDGATIEYYLSSYDFSRSSGTLLNTHYLSDMDEPWKSMKVTQLRHMSWANGHTFLQVRVEGHDEDKGYVECHWNLSSGGGEYFTIKTDSNTGTKWWTSEPTRTTLGSLYDVHRCKRVDADGQVWCTRGRAGNLCVDAVRRAMRNCE